MNKGFLPAIRERFRDKDRSVEELLLELKRYGYPNLYCMKSGLWWCTIDMRVGVEGADFKIKSKSKHSDMKEAVLECHDRVLVALETIEEGIIK
jgi:hypothetical protein